MFRRSFASHKQKMRSLDEFDKVFLFHREIRLDIIRTDGVEHSQRRRQNATLASLGSLSMKIFPSLWRWWSFSINIYTAAPFPSAPEKPVGALFKLPNCDRPQHTVTPSSPAMTLTMSLTPWRYRRYWDWPSQGCTAYWEDTVLIFHMGKRFLANWQDHKNLKSRLVK